MLRRNRKSPQDTDMLRRPLLALAATLALAAPAAAFDPDGFTPAQRDAFGAAVRSYLLDNPEVLLEVIGKLEERQSAAQTADDARLIAVNAEALFDNPASWVGGNPDGDVTLVEFVDYNCGFCRRAFPEVMELAEFDPGVRLVMKELPILGPDSEIASRFAIAVLQTVGADAYAEAHERMMASEGRVGAAAVAAIAAEMGLDFDAITARMDSPDVTAVIAGNRALAQRLGIEGTPSFVLEDRMLRGYLPLTALLDAVDEVRAAN